MGCFFAGNQINIGDHTVINRGVFFDGRVGKIKIGSNVSISQETVIITMSHYINSPLFDAYNADVIIEDYVWTGFRATILPGVVIGKGAVLGVNSLATKSLNPFGIYVGSPARKISERITDLKYSLNYFPYFNTDIT
ncbi:acyltransferase [Elizabethkingia anophelis]|uniref:acyltransferase n=1 Tax=Elizabethkingia anophelis TaxID=1117645 RepID=UPI001623E6E0|nr:acyltransferase [Elizabethkingia anophelis]UTF90559.1 hypothetical protein J2N93_05710 [Elizabethkingia anophelis]UTG01430.1 hypothetical protein J2O04_05710 [Elizabethkingia anophelis]UTG05180.1 hypothetical protein J2O03_05710 [Elizabethkingia anophelis]UTG08921.1 hypothetical protein J2N99_05705 [Elizabethkingia anophelis]UTG12662.1 hypothetical protein J2N92_05700 [Elizabethkingia anophelis]